MPGLVTERKNIQKIMPVRVKDSDAKQGIVMAYGSTFNIIDENYPTGDVVKPAAFKKTVSERGPKGTNQILYCWDHKMDMMILGKPSVLYEDDCGLYFEAKIIRTSYGADILMLYEAEIINEHSIGYWVVKSSYGDFNGERVRFLEQLGLLELSGVPLGMNPYTPTLGLKDNQDAIARLALQLQRVQAVLHSGHFQTDKIAPLLEKQSQEWELLLKAVQPPEPTHDSIITAHEYGEGDDSVMTLDYDKLAGLVVARLQPALEQKDATGKTTWPLADRDTKWDGGEAHKRIVAWAKTDDGYDKGKLESVHFYSPGGDAGENISAYKLLFCDIIGGKPQAVPNAIIACYGSHGVDATKGIEEGDKEAIQKKISTYCAKMRKKFDSADSFIPPWEKSDSEKARQGRMSRKDFRYLMAHKDYRARVMMQAQQRQAKDYQGALLGQQEDLQDSWSDAINAFVACIVRDMWACKYPGMDEEKPDAHEVIATDLQQFTETILELVDKSVAADFVPCADDDGHSFYDPDDDDDDDKYGAWAADTSSLSAKKAVPISAANHKALTDALDDMADGHKKAIVAHKAAKAVLSKMKPSGTGKDDPKPGTSDEDTDNTDETPSQGEKGAGRTSSATTPSQGAGANDTSRTTPEDAEIKQAKAELRKALGLPPL